MCQHCRSGSGAFTYLACDAWVFVYTNTVFIPQQRAWRLWASSYELPLVFSYIQGKKSSSSSMKKTYKVRFTHNNSPLIEGTFIDLPTTETRNHYLATSSEYIYSGVHTWGPETAKATGSDIWLPGLLGQPKPAVYLEITTAVHVCVFSTSTSTILEQ